MNPKLVLLVAGTATAVLLPGGSLASTSLPGESGSEAQGAPHPLFCTASAIVGLARCNITCNPGPFGQTRRFTIVAEGTGTGASGRLECPFPSLECRSPFLGNRCEKSVTVDGDRGGTCVGGNTLFSRVTCRSDPP